MVITFGAKRVNSILRLCYGKFFLEFLVNYDFLQSRVLGQAIIYGRKLNRILAVYFGGQEEQIALTLGEFLSQMDDKPIVIKCLWQRLL